MRIYKAKLTIHLRDELRPIKFLLQIADLMAGINSRIICIENTKADYKRRTYLKELCNDLCLPQIQRRSVQSVGMPMQLQRELQKYRPSDSQNELTNCHTGNRKRCTQCRDLKKVRYTKYSCKKCSTTYFCLEHANMICNNCFAAETTEDGTQE